MHLERQMRTRSSSSANKKISSTNTSIDFVLLPDASSMSQTQWFCAMCQQKGYTFLDYVAPADAGFLLLTLSLLMSATAILNASLKAKRLSSQSYYAVPSWNRAGLIIPNDAQWLRYCQQPFAKVWRPRLLENRTARWNCAGQHS